MAQWDGPPGPRGPREATPFSAAAPGAPPRARPRPSAASPGGTRAANDEAGFDVGHFIGWRRSISSGWCSTGSHTTFHTRPRRSIYIYTCIHIHPVARPLPLPPPSRPGRWRHPPRRPRGPGPPRRAAAPPLLPDSVPSAAPPIRPSLVANWRMLGAYRDRRPEPTTRSPLAHRASRQRPRRPRRSVLLSVTAWHRPYGSTLRIRLVITDDTDMSRTPPHSGYKRPLHPLDRLPFLFFLQTRCSRRWLQ